MPVLWFNEIRGQWTYFLEEAVKLAQSGNEIIVVCPHPGKPYQGKENIKIYRCKSLWLPARGFVIRPFSFFGCMAKVFREVGRIDVVYDNTSGLYPMSFALKIWFAIRGRHTPIVSHVHGELKDLSNRPILSIVFEFYLNIIARLQYMVSDKILVVGAGVRKRVISLGADSRKVRIVTTGIKYHFPQPPAPRTEFGIKKDAFVIGFVGRPTMAKGLDVIMNGFAKANIPDSILLIVGDDAQGTGMMLALSKSLGINDRTKFLGYRHDVPRLLGLMDVFANMTISEGQVSATQIEAMRAGLPSIVSPFSEWLSGKEVLEVTDTKSFAEALIRLYSDEALRKSLSMAAIEKGNALQQFYSWDSYVHNIQSVFGEVIPK